MQGHKKKFRKSLWLGMAWTETSIALTTTTTFTTTTTLSTTTALSTTTSGRCGPRYQGKECSPGMCCYFDHGTCSRPIGLG